MYYTYCMTSSFQNLLRPSMHHMTCDYIIWHDWCMTAWSHHFNPNPSSKNRIKENNSKKKIEMKKKLKIIRVHYFLFWYLRSLNHNILVVLTSSCYNTIHLNIYSFPTKNTSTLWGDFKSLIYPFFNYSLMNSHIFSLSFLIINTSFLFLAKTLFHVIPQLFCWYPLTCFFSKNINSLVKSLKNHFSFLLLLWTLLLFSSYSKSLIPPLFFSLPLFFLSFLFLLFFVRVEDNKLNFSFLFYFIFQFFIFSDLGLGLA